MRTLEHTGSVLSLSLFRNVMNHLYSIFLGFHGIDINLSKPNASDFFNICHSIYVIFKYVV